MVIFAWSSGLISCMTTSFIKVVAELFKSESPNFILQHPLFYSCLIICFLNIFAQLYTLNQALKFYNQLEVVPIYLCSLILNSILCGGIIFDEFRSYFVKQAVLLVIGALVCCFGVLVIIEKYKWEKSASVK